MYIPKNTYSTVEENKDAILESLHDYFKNYYYMKALDKNLGPEFPGNASDHRVQTQNLFYLNVFNSLASNPDKLKDVKETLDKLINLMKEDFRNNSDVLTKILLICAMFKEHFNINLQGIPDKMLSYIRDNIDVYAKGLGEWNDGQQA